MGYPAESPFPFRRPAGEYKLRELADQVWQRIEIDDLEARSIIARLDEAESTLAEIAMRGDAATHSRENWLSAHRYVERHRG